MTIFLIVLAVLLLALTGLEGYAKYWCEKNGY